MTMTDWNDPNAFDGIVNHSFQTNPQTTTPQATPPPYTDPHPYGPPAPHHGPPVKTGLTPRGKAALAIAATIVAGGGLLGWQHYAAAQAANQVKAQELKIEQQKLALEQQKALDKSAQSAQKTQTVAASNRQKHIDACVQNNKRPGRQAAGRDPLQRHLRLPGPIPRHHNGDDMQEAATASPPAARTERHRSPPGRRGRHSLSVSSSSSASHPPRAPVYTGYPSTTPGRVTSHSTYRPQNPRSHAP
jgi:hypothetical protein